MSGLAYKALQIGGTMPATLNAANEIAVQAFLDNKIRLSDIPKIIESVMSEHQSQAVSSLEIVIETDVMARKKAIVNLESLEKVAAANLR